MARSRLEGEASGIPHLAKNERDVGPPAIVAGIEREVTWRLLRVARCRICGLHGLRSHTVADRDRLWPVF